MCPYTHVPPPPPEFVTAIRLYNQKCVHIFSTGRRKIIFVGAKKLKSDQNRGTYIRGWAYSLHFVLISSLLSPSCVHSAARDYRQDTKKASPSRYIYLCAVAKHKKSALTSPVGCPHMQRSPRTATMMMRVLWP